MLPRDSTCRHARTSRRLAAAVALTTGLGFAAQAVAATAAAAPAMPTAVQVSAAEQGDFYTPPAELPARNGVVIRHEPIDGPFGEFAEARRIMYRSTDADGRAIAVTGSVLTPHTPWSGAGTRPLVSFAVGTQGLADKCAPSRQLEDLSEYESGFISSLLVRGYGVAITDYEGLGTPGPHTYVQRVAQGHAVLDVARAAQRLDVAALPDDGRVLMSGYSQGGGAVASALELESWYAPSLDLIGAYAGAVPADLHRIPPLLDGGPYAGLLLYAANGLAAGEDLPVFEVLNARGREAVRAVRHQCVSETVPAYAFTESTSLTRSGDTLSEVIRREPFRSATDRQRLGASGRHPRVPVLVGQSRNDNVIPYTQARALAKRWCAAGTTVQFAEGVAPDHVAAAAELSPRGMAFLVARVQGQTPESSCSEL